MKENNKQYKANTYVTKKRRDKRLNKMCQICSECTNREFCRHRKNIVLMHKCENCKNCTDKETCDVFYINTQSRITIPIVDKETGEVIRKTFSGKDEYEAIYKSQQYLKDVENGTVKPKIKKTVHSIVSIIQEDDDRKSRNGEINDNTYRTSQQTLKRIEMNAWALGPIRNVKREQLEQWLYEERESGKSNSTLKKDYNKLKRAFSIAYYFNYISQNPFMGPYCIQRPISKKKDMKTEAFTLEELKTLINYLDNNDVLHKEEHLICLHTRH